LDGNSTETNLESKRNGHPHNEQKEWHHKVGKIATIPWCVPNHRPLSSGIIHQNHQLQMYMTFTRTMMNMTYPISLFFLFGDFEEEKITKMRKHKC
jgi:hypothetical protein